MQIHGNRRRCETPHIEERTRGALSRSRTRTTAILDDMPHAAARPALGPSAVIPRVGRDPAPSPRRFGARRRPGPTIALVAARASGGGGGGGGGAPKTGDEDDDAV